MLVAIMVILIFQTLFTMAIVGHIGSLEKLVKSLTEAKIEEMRMWKGPSTNERQ